MHYQNHKPLGRSIGPAVACLLILSGCSLLGQGENEQLQQIPVADVHGPDRAVAGESVTFALIGFALNASVRVESRSAHLVEVSVWTHSNLEGEAWCATPPLPQLGVVEATVPDEGTYTLRVLQPGGSVLEKRVMIDGVETTAAAQPAPQR